jgi:hypothetical protein
VRRLQGSIPRAFKSHKTPEGASYGRYCRSWAARFGGKLPEDVRPLVRLAGRLMVEIASLEVDWDRMQSRRRLTEARRIRRQLIGSRHQFLKAQAQLEARAASQVTGVLRALSGGGL